MKKQLIESVPALLSLLVLLAPNVLAQRAIVGANNPLVEQPRGENIISESSYLGIKYNGSTIGQIDATNGTSEGVQQLFGDYSSLSGDPILGNKVYKFGTNLVSFYTGLTRIEVNDSSWPVIVQGQTVKVGDSFSQLQQKFGQNLKIMFVPKIDPNYFVSFNYPRNDFDGFLININPGSHKVVSIVYFVSP